MEKSIGRQFVRWCKAHDVVSIKLTTLGLYGEAGWPDYLVLNDFPDMLFIEMKTDIGKVRKLQELRHEQLRRKGYRVVVARSLDEARAATLYSARLSDAGHEVHGVKARRRTIP